MVRRSLAVFAAAMIAIVAVTGCAGGDDAPTKEEFVIEANAICRDAVNAKNAAIEKAVREQGEARATLERIATTVALPPIEQMVEEIGELEAPEGDEEEVEAIALSFETANAKVKDDPSVVFSAATDPFGEANKLAVDYGLKACGLI